jgi:putative tryptophan/tyrosine transport system substrate-binding protein
MIGRRQFIILLGGAAAAWPLAAGAQQPAMPVVGYLYLGTPEMSGGYTSAFRKGLSEAGFVEGRNVAIEYRYGNNQAERFPELAAELVRRRVAVIAAMGSSAAALAAKNSTTTIPVIFVTGADPVQLGLVASLNRPGGNVTGISSMNAELAPKRLGLLHELLPKAARFGLLSYPTPATEQTVAELRAAATTLGVALEVLQVFTNRDIDAAIEGVAEKRIDALIVTPTQFFSNRRVQLATLAARYAVPMIYSDREIVEAGGLMSYSSNGVDLFRQTGIYTGRVLKGEKPADLPVLRPTKFELVINLHTAKLLRIDVPPTLLALADEVIE